MSSLLLLLCLLLLPVIACCYLHSFFGCNFQCGSVNRLDLRGITRGTRGRMVWLIVLGFDCDAQMSGQVNMARKFQMEHGMEQ